MNSTNALLEKMERRRKELARKDDENKLAMIKRKAKQDGGGKHSISAWMYDRYFGAGDYSASDYGEPQTRTNHE